MDRRRQQESVDRYNRGLDGGSGCLNASYSGTSSDGIRNYGRSNPYNAYKVKQPSSQPAFGKAFVVAGSGKPDYSVGDRVRHIKFGSGTVEQLEKGDKDYEVTVDFDRCGIRKMYASFAKLKKE